MKVSRSAEREQRKEPWPMSWGSCPQRLVDEVDPVPSPLHAGAQHRCKDLLSPSTILGPIPTPHLAIDHRRPDRLLRRPVRRLHSGMTEEAEELVPMGIEVLREALVDRVGLPPRQEPIQAALELPRRHCQAVARELSIVPAVPQPKSILEELLHLARETHCSSGGDLQEVTAAPEKMRQTLLVGRCIESVVGHPSIVPYRTGVVRSQDFLRHLEPSAGPDQVGRRALGHEGPEPLEKSSDFPAGLVGVHRRASSHHQENRAIGIPAALGSPEHDLCRSSPRQADPEGALEKMGQLSVAETQALDEMDRHGLGLWPDLACRGAQGIGGLERMPTLDPAPTAFAPTHLDVEPAVDRLSRDLDLELMLELDELDLAFAVRTGVGQKDPEDLVDLRGCFAEGLLSVLVAGLPATLFRIGLRFSLGEGSGLTLRRLLEALDDPPQPLVLSAEIRDLPPEIPVLLEDLLVGGASRLLAAHQPELSDRPVTNFRPYPLTKYGWEIKLM